MKPGQPELMWARQHAGGDVYEDSLSSTKPWAAAWPRNEQDEAEREKFGEVKLFRVVLEEVSPEEQAEFEARQLARRVERAEKHSVQIDASVGQLTFGALLNALGQCLVISEIGKRRHSKGYGDIDFGAFLLSGDLSPGSIINTPWGYCEVMAAPAKCRIVRVSWDGKKTYGTPGTPQGIASTLAAARAMNEDVTRLLIEAI